MNKLYILALFSLVLLFGCVSSPTKVINQSTNQSINQSLNNTVVQKPSNPILYGGNLFTEGYVSLCKVIPDSDVEEIFGFGNGQLSHSRSHVSLGNVSANTCSYESMESEYYAFKIWYINYLTEDAYTSFVDSLRGEETGKIKGYDYVYHVIGLSVPVLDIKIPKSKTIIKFSASENFKNATKENLIKVAKLFLSRVDPALKQNHTFVKSSETYLTYTGKDIAFDYPSNWVANDMYSGSDDKVSVEDPDGIGLMIIGSGSTSPLFNSESFENFTKNPESYGMKKIDYKSGDNGKYTAISESNGIISIIQSGTAGKKSFFAMGAIKDIDRYNYYKSDIIKVLKSVRPS